MLPSLTLGVLFAVVMYVTPRVREGSAESVFEFHTHS
jgi:hypothetical protein